jgi:hypothetical protein
MLFRIYEGRLEKVVDSPNYSESELCGGAVTVSLLKYLPWQAMHFLQRSTHFSKTCCRPFAASFRRIVEQAVLTSWSLWKPGLVSLHRFHRLDEKRALGTHWIGGLMGPRTGLDAVAKRKKFLAPTGTRIPDYPWVTTSCMAHHMWIMFSIESEIKLRRSEICLSQMSIGRIPDKISGQDAIRMSQSINCHSSIKWRGRKKHHLWTNQPTN